MSFASSNGKSGGVPNNNSGQRPKVKQKFKKTAKTAASKAEKTQPVRAKQGGLNSAPIAALAKFVRDCDTNDIQVLHDPHDNGKVTISCPCCQTSAESKKCEVKAGDTRLLMYCHKCGADYGDIAAELQCQGICIGGTPEAQQWTQVARIHDHCLREVLSKMDRSRRHGNAMRDRGFHDWRSQGNAHQDVEGQSNCRPVY